MKIDRYYLSDLIVLTQLEFQPPYRAQSGLKNEVRIIFVLKGHSQLFTGQGKLDIQEGDYFLMKCENYVNDWKVSERGNSCKIIALRLSSKILNTVYGNSLPFKFNSNAEHIEERVVKIKPNKLLKGFITNLHLYISDSNILSEELLVLKIKELILLLSKNENTFNLVLESLFEKKIYDFNEVIKNNIYENLRLEELAFLCNLSLSSFQRKFKNIYNSSPSKYINKKRIEKAKLLLQQNKMSIAEIGFSVGFESPSHFSKIFKTIANRTPMQYKKEEN